MKAQCGWYLALLADPSLEQFLLGARQRLVRLLRRHDVVARVEDAADEFALSWFAGHDGRGRILALGGGILEAVQAQLGLARRRIRAVTGKAILRKNRPHVAVVFDVHRRPAPGQADHARQHKRHNRI